MKTVYSEDHELHDGVAEFHRGRLVQCFESPKRARLILRAVQNSGLGKIVPPDDFPSEILFQIHDREYVTFLQSVSDEWREFHEEGDALPHAWCVRRMQHRPPRNIYGRLGYYSSDASTPITTGTWKAARSAANVVLTAQLIVQRGDRAAFALTRPPGHHAAKDYCGGYCFLNNAALAAQALLNGGAQRVAILDIDYHHGNGTQDIFYDRNDVYYVSIHGDPSSAYPYFLGYSDEDGQGIGTGFTRNYPLPDGTEWERYSQSLSQALTSIAEKAVDHLVVSLGVDTYEADPISAFRLKKCDFRTIGQALARIALPTVFVMEGGYAIDELGDNVVGVLSGFEQST